MLIESDLQEMSVKKLQLLDIENPKDEALVQKVINEKLRTMPPVQAVSTKGIPDITTREQEAEWQKVMNERVRKAKMHLFDAEEAQAQNSTDETYKEVLPEVVEEPQVEETDEVVAGLEETVEKMKEEYREESEKVQTEESVMESESEEVDSTKWEVKCDECNTKIKRHKKFCSKVNEVIE